MKIRMAIVLNFWKSMSSNYRKRARKNMENSMFLGRADNFTYTFLKKLCRNGRIIWLSDVFSIHLSKTDLSDYFTACSYTDKSKINAYLSQEEHWNLWIYISGLPKDKSIESIFSMLPKQKIQKVFFVIDKDDIAIKAISNDIILTWLKKHVELRYFVIPGLSKDGNGSILDEAAYQIDRYLAMVLSRGYNLQAHPVRVLANGRMIHSLPIETIVNAIMELRDGEKSVYYIYDKHLISLEKIIFAQNQISTQDQLLCKERVDEPSFFDDLFEQMLQKCFPNFSADISCTSDISAGLLPTEDMLGNRIRKAIQKAKIPYCEISYERKSVQRIYSNELTYWVTPNSPETLVIVNAFGAHRSAWDGFISCIQKYFRIIVWEIPGCFSPSLIDSEKGLYCINSQVNDIESVIGAEKIQSFHILAWCSGVKAASIYAAKHPKKVKSLSVLSGDFAPFPNYKGNKDKFIENANLISEIISKKPKLLSIYLKLISENTFGSENNDKFFEAVPIEMHDVFLEQYDHPDWAVSFLRMCVEQYNHDISKFISQLNLPILLITPQYDRVVPSHQATWAIEQVKNGRIVELPIAAHLAATERPKEVAEIIKEQYRYVWA